LIKRSAEGVAGGALADLAGVNAALTAVRADNQ